ncbi:MAG: hypothetical protein J0I01_05600 [Stenotrophomonas nitritireducens]|uniref:hypothetical protein n=1 Tax=Stenotrophomonas nitritireducens TaxID=83617 RepID=UPI001AC36B98|nr:hypothetical protein [Stenotrophomonas nitritireducens]MBN8791686.1 hypothetical protein [Stenotrophomonas nitritireducens]MBN8795624.1 hypothetical protein [Stenotrophomonas nitritireducens]
MKNLGKARWAARRAEALEQEARALAADRSGDWRAHRKREEGAARLRREAARFRTMAAHWMPDEAA